MLNICQVSLERDIPLILKNYENFKNLYREIKIHVICPQKQIEVFKTKLKYDEFQIISEDEIISLKDCYNIFDETSKNISYKKLFEDRINWYYQQILKILFVINFTKKNEKILIWDADTIILKKINFFVNEHSKKYGTFSEFHRPYYKTNEKILKKLSSYYISFLTQFIGITKLESNFLKKQISLDDMDEKNFNNKIVNLIFKSIFTSHKIYNGSMFSEYELIGQSNYIFKKEKQKPILTLRFGLNGKLTDLQIIICKILNFKHVTYEHSHNNKNSIGMLDRYQTWPIFIKLIIKIMIKFYLRSLKHNFIYLFK